MVGVRSIKISINNDISINTDYSCNYKNNTSASWHNECRRIREQYTGEFDEENCIDFYKFNNLYRLYCIDISKQNISANAGVVSITLEFTFIDSTLSSDIATVNYHALAFYDKEIMLNSVNQQVVVLK